jgi:hypothetical protein
MGCIVGRSWKQRIIRIPGQGNIETLLTIWLRYDHMLSVIHMPYAFYVLMILCHYKFQCITLTKLVLILRYARCYLGLDNKAPWFSDL